ncbi:hypothetical protein ACE1B6_10665 [Aerosakkonemataceae cyanobacterium BLCC-F154]|uniref:Uncharacterized protein n=1 Tax=Floridaenema fluviatile BLCC-F154 TaxID=3153640 RepID=A0ABV4YA70_9CYAN
MGHLNITATTLLLAVLSFSSQSLHIQAQTITTEKAENSANVNSIISYPVAVANDDHRGSGR